MKTLSYCRCNVKFSIPDSLHDAARHEPSISFWCPYGHEQHFPRGQTEEEKLRLERDRMKQQIAQRDDEIRTTTTRADRAERIAARLKKRASAGSCPCCKRTFTNMARHMKTKHPAFLIEPIKLVAST